MLAVTSRPCDRPSNNFKDGRALAKNGRTIPYRNGIIAPLGAREPGSDALAFEDDLERQAQGLAEKVGGSVRR